jgi:hypothetical protein
MVISNFKITKDRNLLQKSHPLVLVALLIFIAFNGLSQYSTKNSSITELDDSDSLYQNYQLFKDVTYHELMIPLEEYDLNPSFYKEQQLGCHFVINNHRISIAEILQDVFYEVGWHLNPNAVYINDSGREYLIVTLAFYSGSSSHPVEYNLSVNLSENTVVKM